MNLETDLLMSRVVDGEASTEEWLRLTTIANAQPSLWRDIAEAQREHAVLQAHVGHAGAIADRVDLETDDMVDGAGIDQHGPLRRMAWSGWAVAALIGVAASVQVFRPATPLNNATTVTNAQAGLPNPIPAIQNARAALDTYLDLGRESGDVIAELPTKTLVETRPAPDGNGYELLYIRQILERTRVPDLYEYDGQNEFGQPTITRVQQPGTSGSAGAL